MLVLHECADRSLTSEAPSAAASVERMLERLMGLGLSVRVVGMLAADIVTDRRKVRRLVML